MLGLSKHIITSTYAGVQQAEGRQHYLSAMFRISCQTLMKFFGDNQTAMHNELN